MIKSELITTLCEDMTHVPEHQITDGINHILELMSQTLIQGGRIEIRGFGSFCLHDRAPRHAHNPKTGEKITTEAKRTPHFKPGKALRERVNDSRKTHPIKED